MVYGVWCAMYGVWCVMYGVWCMVYVPRSTLFDFFSSHEGVFLAKKNGYNTFHIILLLRSPTPPTPKKLNNNGVRALLHHEKDYGS